MKKLIKSCLLVMALAFLLPIKADAASYDTEVRKILRGIDKSWNAEEKLFYLHDYLVTHTEYDESYEGTSAYDAIVNHKAVCEGYALAFKDLANRAGIKTEMIVSRQMNHAWNAVKLNGNWYYIDCTFDDPLGSSPSECSHKNFLRNEAGLRASDHTGSDWKIGFDGSRVTGKYKDSTYEKMSWHEAEKPVVCLTGSVAYTDEKETGVYIYNCDKKTPKQIFSTSGRYDDFLYMTGKGKNLFIGNDTFIYSYKKGMKSPKVSYELSEDEKRVGKISDLLINENTLRYNLSTSIKDRYGSDQLKKIESAGYIESDKLSKSSVTTLSSKESMKTIKKGSTAKLKVSSNAKKIRWTSDNKKIATVSDGKVTGKSKGICTITARAGDKETSWTICVQDDSINDPTWLSEFDYSVTTLGYIALVEYRGDKKDLKIPAKVKYEGKEYDIKITQGIIHGDSAVENLSFEPGVAIKTYELAYGCQNLKKIDLRGCTFDEQARFKLAYGCPKLEEVNLGGLDISGLNMGSIVSDSPSFKALVMPDKLDATKYIQFNSSVKEEDTDWRVYSNGEYGAERIKTLDQAPAGKTLKMYPGAKKKGKSFTVKNVTYKITESSRRPLVTVTKIKGKDVIIPDVVKYEDVAYIVTQIGPEAAKGNTSIKSLTIGRNVSKIGQKAFYGCSGIKKITIKSGVLGSAGARSFERVNAQLKTPQDCKAKYEQMFKKAGLKTK